MLTLNPRFEDSIPAELQSLANQYPTLARVLAGRGVTSLTELDTRISQMLPATGLRDLNLAAEILDKAIDEQKKILIVGDFDCDGATSTALMVRVLRAMGAKVEFLVPDRFKYGYGLTPQIVELGIDTYSPDVIVTVDNGISSHEGVALAKAHGLTVIITDHHLTNQEKPNADAVVNPNQLGCDFASKSLVGVGVAFYLLGNLAKIRRQVGKSTTQVTKYMDLVALGTVADVGVLDKNNRILVHHGLQAIRRQQCCVGILALLEQAGRASQDMTVQDFGFILGPRINAAGRMDSMRIGIECLLTDDWGEAQRLAFALDKLNRERRQVEQSMRRQADTILADLDFFEDANTHSQKRGIVLYQDDWHQGVIGIVAGRLKETYHLPAIVFAPADTEATGDNDAIKGSARSIPGVHIRDVIERVAQTQPDLISVFGGHAMAAGLTIQKQHFAAFCEAFESVLNTLDNTVFNEALFSDGQLAPHEFSLDFVDTIENIAIWGQGFVPPLFDGVFTINDFKVLKEKHVKLWLTLPNLSQRLPAIWFNVDFEKFDMTAIQKGTTRIHLLFELQKNEYNQNVSLQLQVKKASLL